MPSNKIRSLGKSRRCVVKRRGRKSMKLAKSKTRRYMSKKRVYRGGLGFDLFKSKDTAAAPAATAAEKSAAAAEAAKAAAEAAEAAKAAAEAAKAESAKAPRDANKALKAAKAAAEAAAAEAAAAAAEAVAAEAAAAVAELNPLINTWNGEYAGPAAEAVGIRTNALGTANRAKKAAAAAAAEARKAASAAYEAERVYVKNQMSQFSRTTLPFMTFLYADASVPVPSDSDLQAAYKADKELKQYQITSLDEVKMIDLAKYTKYLKVFLTHMFNEFETTMDKKEIVVPTEFTQEEVEFTGFLNALIAIQGISSVEERATALPEALFEAFSKLSDPKYVMLIMESKILEQDGTHPAVYSYSKINKTGKEVNKPHEGEQMSFRVVNGYNSMYLWTLLSRNYYDFYSVIIDKMFTGSVKITFEEFIRRYNEWTLKKSKEAKDTIIFKNDSVMTAWISTGAYELRPRRLYLRPFEKLKTDHKGMNPRYDDDQHLSEKAILIY